ncbi:MAG TPA: metal ABC transporter permease [Mycobacteriales bacterium]|jgi:zinc/manganese transport system permease protein|nr:metal ABC transporter permease [Mycobacteriales bacterium]
MTGRFSLNLLADLREILGFSFMVHAFLAGAAAAVLGGAVGWFMVLRRQAFAGHTLAVVSFPGAAAAGWLGLPLAVGYFGACVLAALAIGLLPPTVGGSGRSEESAVIGTVQAFLLAAGFLFVSLYRGFLGGIDALLFGSFLGISAGRVVVVAAVSVGCLLALGLIGRPLLFASVDPGVAAARGIPVRLLSALMLLVLGLAAAEISQITGALLVFALLVMPAAAAQQLTARPGPGLALAAGLGVAIVWLSLVIAYYAPYPVGFFTTSVGLVVYLLSVLLRRVRDGRLVTR